jgi:SAM-dependent methyltransferase
LGWVRAVACPITARCYDCWRVVIVDVICLHWRVRGSPRASFGARLGGAVMEIGPGHEPFPVADGASVTYVDKSVEGGRDKTWPELVGAPHGPKTDVDVDLDTEGLRVFADASFDAVIASHVLEHVADPIAAILEIDRVLRPGGLAVIVMPDRHLTFDRVREPTTLAHLLDEHDRGTAVVDEEHIRDFCEAIWEQDRFLPEPVWSWFNPSALDRARYDLHRRRTIHVHCWSADEFAVLLAGLVADGLGWELVDQFVADDSDPPTPEFGVLLRRTGSGGRASAMALVERWARAIAGSRPERRSVLVDLARTIARDLGAGSRAVPEAVAIPSELLATEAADLARQVAALDRQAADNRQRIEELDAALAAVFASATWKTGRFVMRPVHGLRSRARRRRSDPS